jgi:hypothetical protein
MFSFTALTNLEAIQHAEEAFAEGVVVHGYAVLRYRGAVIWEADANEIMPAASKQGFLS